jgi:hypothetical protein
MSKNTLLVLGILKTEKSRVRDRFISIQNIPDEGHYSFRKKWDLL